MALAAFSNVAAAASSTDRRLRGSSSNLLADKLPSEEVPSLHVDGEERKLKRDREPGGGGGNGGGGNGGGKGKQTTETTSTEAPLPLPEEPAGGAEAPPANSTYAPTPTPIPAVCEPACGADEMCARSSPSAEAQCYPKCSGFPVAAVNTTDACAGTDTCVYSTFTCGGYEGVFNEFCQCSIDGSVGCLYSDCGLAAP